MERPLNTSLKAYDSVQEIIPPLQQRVLSFIRSRGTIGATDEEIALCLALNPSTSRPRRIELANDFRIFNSGEFRKTKSGRKAAVWKAPTHA